MTPNYGKFIGIALAYIAIVFTIFFISQTIKKKRAQRINKSAVINKRGKNKLYPFYKLFRNTPGFKKIFEKILRETEMIYPSDPLSVNREATKITLKGIVISVGIALATILMAKGDLLFVCMGVLAGAVVFSYSVTSTFNKMEYKLLVQMQDFLSTVRSHYINRGIVEDAIEDTLDEIPYEIGLHISKIYEILVSPIMDEKVEEYTASSPNRFFLLLLSICSSIKEYGGDSFLDSLSHLKEEINVEILKKNAIKNAFASLQFICLVVVLFLKPVEIWSVSNMPELSAFYNGSYGKLLLVLIFVLSFISYFLVDILRDSKQGSLIKTSVFMKLSNLPVISVFFNKLVNKNYTRARLLNEKMKEVGDQTGPKAFLVKQCVIAIATFLFLNSTFLVSTVAQKFTMLKDYVAEFDTNIVPNEKYMEAMQESAYDCVQRIKKEKVYDRENIKQEVLNEGQIHNEEYAGIVADEVIREMKAYRNTYYKWYHLALSLFAAFIAFQIPKWFLDFKCKVAGMSKEDEVAQFQTLILILMNVDGMSLDIILEWMERFAYSFKTTIEDCIITLESGEKEALETMRASEDNSDFRRFVDCLIAIDETDVKTAFNEIVIDRDYSLRNREQKNTFAIQRKSGTAKAIAFTPFMVMLIGYLLLPMTIMAAKMLFAMDLSI